jgi:hypothetical protein
MDILNKYEVVLNARSYTLPSDDKTAKHESTGVASALLSSLHRHTYCVEASTRYLAICEAYRCWRGIPSGAADMCFPPLALNPVAQQVS